MSEGDLEGWVAQAARGDRNALRELFDRYHAKVARVAQSFASLDGDDVDDVVQESFARAFRGLAGLSAPAAFEPWLLTIARNRSLSLHQKKSRQRHATEQLEREPLPEPGDIIPLALQTERELDVVRALIAELPVGPEKQTVDLFYLQGQLSAREIAEQLGVGKSTITMRLERFRDRVRQELVRRLLETQWK